jgi:hypothetical protein
MSYADLETYLVELLMKQDQMSMAASVESRVPFLDHQLVERVARMPTSLKLRGWRTKAVLRSALRDLVPREILVRRKMGFPVPVGRWLRGDFRLLAQEFVQGPRAQSRGLFEPAALSRLCAEHAAGTADHGDRLWLLMNLEIWQRIFSTATIRRASCRRRDAHRLGEGRRTLARRPGRTAAQLSPDLGAVASAPVDRDHDARGGRRSGTKTGAVDLCVADFLAAVSNVPPTGGVPVVLFQHNVEHLIWQRLARTEPRRWRRALLEIEWRKTRRIEARACADVRLTLAVSPADRDLLRRLAPRASERA